MSAIYLHIPFCKRLCGYCDFRRTTALRYMPQVVAKMHDELEGRADFLHDRTIRTIYFGGGTPSLLSPDEISRFIDHISRLFDTSAIEEVTLEANPDDVTKEYVEALRRTAINRLSLGVQSLDDEVLRFMGRRHSAEGAIAAIRRLQDSGYDNISADLIFGVPCAESRSVERSVEGLISLDVQHISAYHLTVEPNTRFGRMEERGELKQVAEQTSESEYLTVHEALTSAGFEHYEISNYAREGFRSRHNSSYWTGAEYLGIGAGAHSFDGARRVWCEQSAEEYATEPKYDEEQLSLHDKINEYIMTSLRRSEGINMGLVASCFGASEAARILRDAEPFLKSQWLVREQDTLRIPAERWLVSDAVIEAMFI